MAKPRINVLKIGPYFCVVLYASRIKALGFRAMIICRTLTRDAAEDWICRLKSLRTKSRVRRFLVEEADLI